MNSQFSEAAHMQNTALGATALWRFVCGYQASAGAQSGVPLPLCFVVLPCVFHTRTSEAIQSTNVSSGLRKFEEKHLGNQDLLLSIHSRVLAMREVSLNSLRLAILQHLVILVPEVALVYPTSRSQVRAMPLSVKPILASAEKLGKWCGRLTLLEVSSILKVEF